MPQYPLDFRQLCPTFQHPPGQTVAKHMRGDIFQPPRQVYERLAACDVSLTLYRSRAGAVRRVAQAVAPFVAPPAA